MIFSPNLQDGLVQTGQHRGRGPQRWPRVPLEQPVPGDLGRADHLYRDTSSANLNMVWWECRLNYFILRGWVYFLFQCLFGGNFYWFFVPIKRGLIPCTFIFGSRIRIASCALSTGYHVCLFLKISWQNMRLCPVVIILKRSGSYIWIFWCLYNIPLKNLFL